MKKRLLGKLLKTKYAFETANLHLEELARITATAKEKDQDIMRDKELLKVWVGLNVSIKKLQENL